VRLTVRLWIFGALLPVLGFVAATFAGAAVFRAELERAVDRALLSQAATEAVSLFDGVGPHLHLASSPLEVTVRRVAPEAALYGPDGELLLRHPSNEPALTETRLELARASEEPVLTTRPGPHGERVRVVTLAVAGEGVPRHGLQLAASLERSDASVTVFRRTGLGMALGLGAFLLAVQGFLARKLAWRVGELSRHMAALREGNLQASPPVDVGRDEIGELSRVVAEATERLRRARAAQERLMAEAAHELRTPLQLMRTAIDLALRRERAPSELSQALGEIRHEVDRLACLATRLLDLAAAERGAWDRTPGDLALVASEAAEAIRAEAETRGVLVEVDAPEPVPASFDAGGIRQAVDNLLGNAVKYGPEGGTVRVLVRRENGLARVFVHDDGPGIPAEERERVFEPFERGRACKEKGAGLGLAIVREVAHGHGGRAYVAEGAGGNLVVEIPARAS
jgi:signal transduction histidine kinase